MARTTVGQILLADILPPKYRKAGRVLDKHGRRELYTELAEQGGPDTYREIGKKLTQLARNVVRRTGGYSFDLEHLLPSQRSLAMREKLRRDVMHVLRTERDPAKRDAEMIRLMRERRQAIEDAAYQDAIAAGNPLALQVASGSRGNKTGFKSIVLGDGLYEDHKGNIVPIPVFSSYGEGLKDYEYFAGAGGARKSVTSVKLGTAKSGFMAKMLAQASHDLVVTADDDPDLTDDPGDSESERDFRASLRRERADRGLPVKTLDPQNEGSLLAQAVGPYKAGTILDAKSLKHIAALGRERILVRSPLASRGGPGGGLLARDLGVWEKGTFEPIGTNAGLPASQSVSEAITQSALSSKHSGGVAGSSSKLLTGFDRAQALVQTPKTFPGGAAHAQEDGVVQRIDPAPQGGQYIYVSGKRYYAPENLPPTVKVGQQVEAGDTLTEGMANPAELQRLKGIGAARQYLLGALGDYGGRRKLEILVRGLINHVELDDDMDEIPHATIGDVVPYHVVERAFRPPPSAREVPVREALNRYLMRPALHHTLGTRIKPSTVKEMEEFGIKTLLVDDNPPPFRPRPVRAMDLMSHHPDFMAKQLGSGVKGSVLSAAQRGSSSNPRGTSYASALGLDPMNFGLAGLTKSPPPVGQQAAISHELDDEDDDDEASIGVVR